MFADRRNAGRKLAVAFDGQRLVQPFVLALPRGGVPVAYEVARRLDAPLDVLVVRKLGAPTQPEFGVGAIAEGGTTVIDEATCRALGLDRAELEAIAFSERVELDRRVEQYRGGRALPSFHGRDLIVVDDGLATGVTARAALAALQKREPRRLIMAAPVCAPETAAELEAIPTEVVCLARPVTFAAVGPYYDRFDQTTDEEVLELLAAAELSREASARSRSGQ